MRRFPPFSAALGLGLALYASAPTAHAAIVADFTAGTGTANSNQYAGTAGNGWSTAWGTLNTNSGQTTVINTNPLTPGGGNYLQVTKAGSGSSSTLRRGYTSTGEVDISQPHRISFDYRYNSSLSSFTLFSDRLAISGDTDAVTGTAATNTWIVGVAASNSGAGTGQSVFAGNWFFFDNNGNSDFSTSNMVDTGIALVSGRTYSIALDVNPLTGTYSASINDGVNPAFSATDLTFRRGSGAAATDYMVFSTNTSATSEVSVFSVDNVVIIPEPGATGLLAAAALTLALRRSRRRG